MLFRSGSESPFLDAAKRGELRTSSPEYLALYDKFRDWKDTPGDAPGPVLPPRPDIGFPSGDSGSNPIGGGAFEPTPPSTNSGDGTANPADGEADKSADAAASEAEATKKSDDAEAASDKKENPEG